MKFEIGLLSEAAFKTTFLEKQIKITNLCKISDILFKSCNFADFHGRRHIVFAKVLKAVTFFRINSILDVDWAPNTPLERFIQNVPRKELAIVAVKKYFAFITNKLAVSSTTDISLKNKIFVDVFLIEDMSMLHYESRSSCSFRRAL